MHTCPNCGLCPHCGRSDQPLRPAPHPYRRPIWAVPPWYYRQGVTSTPPWADRTTTVIN